MRQKKVVSLVSWFTVASKAFFLRKKLYIGRYFISNVYIFLTFMNSSFLSAHLPLVALAGYLDVVLFLYILLIFMGYPHCLTYYLS